MTKSIQDIEAQLIDLASKVLEGAQSLDGKEQADAFKAATGFYTAYKKAHAAKGGKLPDDDRPSSSFAGLQKKMNDIQKAH